MTGVIVLGCIVLLWVMVRKCKVSKVAIPDINNHKSHMELNELECEYNCGYHLPDIQYRVIRTEGDTDFEKGW